MTKFKVGDAVVTTGRMNSNSGGVLFYADKEGEVLSVVRGGGAYKVRFRPHSSRCPCCRSGSQEFIVPASKLKLLSSTFSIGDTVSLRKGLGNGARKGDQGVITSLVGDTAVVKLNAVQGKLPTGEPTWVDYLTVHAALRDLTRVRYRDDNVLTTSSPKNRAEVIQSIVQRREIEKAGNKAELSRRLNRFRELTEAAGRAQNLSREEILSHLNALVNEGFLKERWLHFMADDLASSKKAMKYPWEAINKREQLNLIQAGTPMQAANRLLGVLREARAEQRGVVPAKALSEREEQANLKLYHAVATWGRSGRRLVRVSGASRETLMQVAVERAARGLSSVCQWDHLTTKGGTLIPYGSGIMFHWEGMAAGEGSHTITYGSPKGVFLGEELEFIWWRLSEANEEWWYQGYSHIWHSVDREYVVNRATYDDQVSTAIRDLRVAQAAIGLPLTHLEAAEQVLSRPSFALVHMTVNLLSALHNFAQEVAPEGTKPKKEKKKGRRAPYQRRIYQINLDENGLSTWATTWARAAAESEGGGGHGSPGGLVSLHTRKGHMSRMWVLRANVRPGEKVLATRVVKTKRGDHEHCLVKRTRKGCSVGSAELKPRPLRVRRGVDDLVANQPLLKEAEDEREGE